MFVVFLITVHTILAIIRAFFGLGLYENTDKTISVFGKSWSPRNTYISTLFVMSAFILKQLFWQIKFPDKIRLISRHPKKDWYDDPRTSTCCSHDDRQPDSNLNDSLYVP